MIQHASMPQTLKTTENRNEPVDLYEELFAEGTSSQEYTQPEETI